MRRWWLFMPFALALLILGPSPAFGAGAKSGPVVRELAIELGAPFRDHAILQRGMKVPVWGWSQPGTMVSVSFAGQTQTATAGKGGKWMAWLEAMDASFEPREMVIKENGGKNETLKNILVGEVWMASGQSNMQWTGTKSAGGKLITKPRNGVAPIREFRVQGLTSQLHPIERADGAWRNGDTVNYSAIAYAFANKLYLELDVPVGILNCSFSQTPIQAWVPRQGYAAAKDEYSLKIHQKCLETVPGTPEHKAAWEAFYASLENQIKVNQERVEKGERARDVEADLPGNLNGNRDANWLFSGILNPVVPYAIRGGIWNQGYANMGEGLVYYNNLHSLINGWRIVWDRPELPVYFHQFYGIKGNPEPSMDSAREMRLGTWMARDIPNAGMASQIDIGGGIHYYNKVVPGRRLALHALKNQYPSTELKAGGLAKDLVAEGPMYKSYQVEGNKVIVTFENAEGGLVAGDTSFNRSKAEGATGFADPKSVVDGEKKMKLFYLAGEDKVWHPASIEIQGSKVVVTSPDVKKPVGVSYGMAGDGYVNLYNQAMLPMTPFIFYDQKLVTRKTWPEEKLKIAGKKIDPNSIGLSYEWRKMPILPPQFRDNAVLQAGQPITFWGSTQKFGEWGEPAEGKKVIHFKFGNIEKEIAIADKQDEWSYTVPAMKATTQPRTLEVSFTIDGELAHKRVCTGMVVGDVIYVAASHKPEGHSPKTKKGEKKPKPFTGSMVRMIMNQSKRTGNSTPSRYSVCVSRTPKNRFAAFWRDATGLAAEIGKAIHAKTGMPVGVVWMDASKNLGKGKGSANVPLKNWMSPSFLKQAPSLMEDYKAVGSQYPDNPYYIENVHRYIKDWKGFWGEYIPTMIETKAVPEGAKWGDNWGSFPSQKSEAAGDSTATHAYNISVHPFSPMAVSAAVFLTTDSVAKEDHGANFGSEMSALGNSFKGGFGGKDFPFVYGVPSETLAPKVTPASSIKGKSQAVELEDWSDTSGFVEAVVSAVMGSK